MSFARRLDPVGYAVRPRVIAHHLGQLALVVAVLMLFPLAVALVAGDTPFALRSAAVVALLVLLGLPLSRLPGAQSIQTNEALVVVGLTVVLTAFAMSFPLASADLAYIDALFEAVSAVTTTGLSTLASVEGRSAAFLFARAWVQWFGGLGIVVFSIVLLLMEPGVASKRLATAETREDESLHASTRIHARRMLAVYLVLTSMGVALLWALGVSPFDALTHTFAALSTGGFSTYDDSLSGLGGVPVQAAITALAFLGAVSLPLYWRTVHEGPRTLLCSFELRGLVSAVLLSTLLLVLVMHAAGAWSPDQILVHAPLMAISAQTTTGFASLPVATLTPAAQLVLIVSMLIGGSVGSTSGGIKILRLLIILRLLQLVLLRTRLTRHAVAEPRLGDERLGPSEIERTLGIVVLMGMTVAISWLAFLLTGHTPMAALFDVVSATTTTGLSSGVTSPGLAPGLKLVLCADMVLGRVEFLALLVLVFPRTWLGRRMT